jgi:hypothetical protein
MYSYAQLEGLWTSAGGSAAEAPIMAAIAMAESGGGANSTNSNSNGTIDRGLWQINSIWGGLSTFDPNANAKAAVHIRGVQGLKAWSTYNNGAYRRFLKNGVAPVNGGPSGGSTPASGGLVSDIGGAIGKGFADAFLAIFMPFIKLAIWGLEAAGGAFLMGLGVFMILQESPSVRSAEKSIGEDALMVAEPEAAPAIEAEKKMTAVGPGSNHKVVSDWGFGKADKFTSNANIPPEIENRRA